MPSIRDATKEDIEFLAKNLREDDRAELTAATGSKNIQQILSEGWTASSVCKVAIDDSAEPFAIFGVVPMGERTGSVWMAATPEIEDNWLFSGRKTLEWVKELFKGYLLLGNYVHAQNDLHIKWLKWAGFTFTSQSVFINNNLFLEFFMEAPADV